MTDIRQCITIIPTLLLLFWIIPLSGAVDPSTDATCFSDAGIAAVSTMGGGGGSLLVLSCPTGGSVYLDGFYAGTTPLQVQAIPNGTYTVRISKTGYQVYQESVSVNSDTPAMIKAALVPIFYPTWPPVTYPTYFPTYYPTYYPYYQNQIYISTTPSGASIFLDGAYMGVTPMTLRQVTPGTHQIVLRYPGYNDYLYTITVSQVSISSIIVQLTPTVQTVTPTLIPTVIPTQVSGSIIVNSIPSGASTYLDGQYSGVTPITLNSVPPGNHNLELRLSGYNTWNTGVSVSNQGTTTLTATLTPEQSPQGGKVTVSSVPSGAKVYLDSVYKGMTPVIISGISTGSHQVTVRLSGYEDWKTGISVTPSTETTLSVQLKKSGSSKPNGYYAVHSNVNGAKVYFDDKLMGVVRNNGLSVRATSTQYQTYRVEMSGYEPYYGEITEMPYNGGIIHLDAMLIRTNYYGRELGWYVIRTNLNGAKVYFDGKYVGTTQNYGFVYQVYPATTQYNRYKVTYPGYKTVEDYFTESPDMFGTVDVDVTLVKN